MKHFTINSILTSIAVMVMVACGSPGKDVAVMAADTPPTDTTDQSDALVISGAEDTAVRNKEDIETEAEQPEDDCIFDLITQTDEFVRQIDEFRNYTWDDQSKTATILLQNGDTLYAQRGGCNYFTYSGRLITKENPNVMDTAYWLAKGKWLAERIFRDYDKEIHSNILNDSTYSVYNRDGELFIDFEGNHNYSEFYQYTRRKGECVETEIMFYMD